LTLRRLRQTMETRIPVGIPRGALDPLNAVLRVHADSVEPAQAIVEGLLADVAKQWELTGVTRGDQGQSQLDYIVRLRSRARRGELLRHLRDRGVPHTTGAEFR
jgi:SRSO17 transposase